MKKRIGISVETKYEAGFVKLPDGKLNVCWTSDHMNLEGLKRYIEERNKWDSEKGVIEYKIQKVVTTVEKTFI
jgi:hypothetical protein